jgi:hypothetical protein
VWVVASLVIAVVYYFVWPKPVNDINSRPFWRHVILRYFHSMVWVLLAISFLLRLTVGDPLGVVLGDVMAMTAFVVYLVFLAIATIDKRASS